MTSSVMKERPQEICDVPDASVQGDVTIDLGQNQFETRDGFALIRFLHHKPRSRAIQIASGQTLQQSISRVKQYPGRAFTVTASSTIDHGPSPASTDFQVSIQAKDPEIDKDTILTWLNLSEPKVAPSYTLVDLRPSDRTERASLGLGHVCLQPGAPILSRASHIPGIQSPYIYISSHKGSIQPFHREDCNLASANFLDAGASKLWIIIPPFEVHNFETAILVLCLINRHICTQFVRHQEIFITPKLLRSWRIAFTIVVQRPGDLIIVDGDAYHAVRNTGCNIAEAVNFCHQTFRVPQTYRNCSRTCGASSFVSKECLELSKFRSFRCNALRLGHSSRRGAADDQKGRARDVKSDFDAHNDGVSDGTASESEATEGDEAVAGANIDYEGGRDRTTGDRRLAIDAPTNESEADSEDESAPEATGCNQLPKIVNGPASQEVERENEWDVNCEHDNVENLDRIEDAQAPTRNDQQISQGTGYSGFQTRNGSESNELRGYRDRDGSDHDQDREGESSTQNRAIDTSTIPFKSSSSQTSAQSICYHPEVVMTLSSKRRKPQSPSRYHDKRRKLVSQLDDEPDQPVDITSIISHSSALSRISLDDQKLYIFAYTIGSPETLCRAKSLRFLLTQQQPLQVGALKDIRSALDTYDSYRTSSPIHELLHYQVCAMVFQALEQLKESKKSERDDLTKRRRRARATARRDLKRQVPCPTSSPSTVDAVKTINIDTVIREYLSTHHYSESYATTFKKLHKEGRVIHRLTMLGAPPSLLPVGPIRIKGKTLPINAAQLWSQVRNNPEKFSTIMRILDRRIPKKLTLLAGRIYDARKLRLDSSDVTEEAIEKLNLDSQELGDLLEYDDFI